MPHRGTRQSNTLPTVSGSMSKILIRQRRSLIGQPQKMRRVVRALGLRRVRHRVIKKDTDCIRGMINKAVHLLEYELLRDEDTRGAS